jgi:hypothetical protein
MNEQFYELYKSMRELVEHGDKDLSAPFQELLKCNKLNCERLDRSEQQYFRRYLNEKHLLFRFHKGGLEESMQTLKVIDSFEHLLLMITSYWGMPFTNLTIKPYIYDERIKWDTQIVMIHEDDKHYPVGFLNRKPDWQHQPGEVNVD